MAEAPPFPDFILFGETTPFPDILHVERIADRAPAPGWTIAPLDLGAGAFLHSPPGVVHGHGLRPRSTGQVVTPTRALLASPGPGAQGFAAALAPRPATRRR